MHFKMYFKQGCLKQDKDHAGYLELTFWTLRHSQHNNPRPASTAAATPAVKRHPDSVSLSTLVLSAENKMHLHVGGN